MVLLCVRSYKHGRTAFEAGRRYNVPDLLAGFLIGIAHFAPDEAYTGEVVSPAVEELVADAPRSPAEVVTLEVQDVTHVAAVPSAG